MNNEFETSQFSYEDWVDLTVQDKSLYFSTLMPYISYGEHKRCSNVERFDVNSESWYKVSFCDDWHYTFYRIISEI